MQVLIAIALKSLLLAGLTLGLLQLLKSRSAAERSWVAHMGLLALIILALAPLALPTKWNIEAPALYSQPEQVSAPVGVSTPLVPSTADAANHNVVAPVQNPVSRRLSINPVAAATAAYALPALALLLITLLALVRLVTLRARADVLVDGHWLSALARAQRRMGFKHGTALLTSNELASPISWGLMRPVILLNSKAVEASGEAEAIIAHELAHVARMDWIKLLLARIATALFWFNPLVWVLAREAHQLREEAADDSVLAADIPDTDYAQLLVGVARHECPSLLLGAHGVAPSKSSLARRVTRVLDGKSVRGPVARSFAVGVFAGAVLVAAPLAALTLSPAQPRTGKAPSSRLSASEPAQSYYQPAPDVAVDIPHLIASGVSTSVSTAAAAVGAHEADVRLVGPDGATVDSSGGMVVSRSPSGATVTVYPPDAQGRRKVVARAPNGATSISYDDDRDHEARRHHDDAIDTAVQMKALGVTPEYIALMRSISPALRDARLDDIIGMRAVGVTPDYIRALAQAGFGDLDADAITQARAVGLTPGYMQAIRATGARPTLDEFVELQALGISPDELARVRSNGPLNDVKIKHLLKSRPPLPPPPPSPPGDPDDG